MAAAYAMNKAGLERNENIFRFTNSKGRLRNRLGDAVRWPTLVRIVEATHIAGERPAKGSGFTCRTSMNTSSAATYFNLLVFSSSLSTAPFHAVWRRRINRRRDPRPCQTPESCLAYRGKTATGGGFAAGLVGSANGASGTAMIFESTGFSPSTAWTLASCGLCSVICAPIMRTAWGASA